MEFMTIHNLIKVAVKKLTTSTSPELDGEVLLSFVLNKSKEYLLAHPFQKVSPINEKKYLRLINKRLLGWPVAYLTKHKEFYGLDFYVDKNVLIPRPETEGLVELVLSELKDKKHLNILDVGTGSGCIIITLAKQLGKRHNYLASDISPRALMVAKKNAKRHGVKIYFTESSILEAFRDENFDVIIGNLPYGWKKWKNNTSANTLGLKFEPQEALFTTEEGLFWIKGLLLAISKKQNKPKTVLLEIDPRQSRALKKLATNILPAYQTKIFKDLSSQDRYAVLELASAQK